MEKHTEGRLKVWPTHWAGGSSSVQVDGHNTIWLDSDSGEVARLRTENGRVTDKTYANADRLASCWNAFAGTGIPTEEIEGAIGRLVKAARDSLHTLYNEDDPQRRIMQAIELKKALSAFEKVEKGGES